MIGAVAGMAPVVSMAVVVDAGVVNAVLAAVVVGVVGVHAGVRCRHRVLVVVSHVVSLRSLTCVFAGLCGSELAAPVHRRCGVMTARVGRWLRMLR